jgi:hypothetical protein
VFIVVTLFFNSLCPQKKIVVSVETLKPVKPVPASQLATQSDVDRVIKLVHSLLQELHLDGTVPGTRVNGFQVLERIFPVLWIGIRIRMVPLCFGCVIDPDSYWEGVSGSKLAFCL